MLDYYGERGLILFRKHAVKYMFGMPHVAALRAQLVTCESVAEFHDLVGDFQRQYEQGVLPHPSPHGDVPPLSLGEGADEDWSCDRVAVACA
jgi:hypothetical protein